jgi:hypothetical protein
LSINGRPFEIIIIIIIIISTIICIAPLTIKNENEKYDDYDDNEKKGMRKNVKTNSGAQS